MTFRIRDRRRFALNGTNGRWFHLATITHGLREFIYFVDVLTNKTYIEEVTGGHLEAIVDESLWQELAAYLQEQGLTYFYHREQ